MWLLEEGMAFLNHGAFGATPRSVLAEQARIRAAMERQPLRFFVDEAPGATRAAAASIARYVGAHANDVALCENTTSGVNAVLQSFPFEPGDRVLSSNHLYPAVAKTLEYVCRRQGATLDLAQVPCPVGSPSDVVRAFEEAITSRTRLLVVDHVTSMTALIFPVEELVALARSRGIPILIDGAHAPGMLPLDLPALGATWYVGNCHKWLCAPKGAALLWAHPDDPLARGIHPPVISHSFGEPFPSEFDWVGTRDISSWLAIPAALAFRAWLGDSAVRDWNHRLAMHGGAAVASSTGAVPTGPESMIGSMVSLQVPGFLGANPALGDRLRSALWAGERIEVACPVLDGRLYVRVSGQVYNEESATERLAAALPRYLAALE